MTDLYYRLLLVFFRNYPTPALNCKQRSSINQEEWRERVVKKEKIGLKEERSQILQKKTGFIKKKDFMTPTPCSGFTLEEIDFIQNSLERAKDCFLCQSSITTRWYKDPSGSQKDLCLRCYEAQRRALSLMGAPGKACSIPSCQTTSTSNWYKDPSGSQKDLCQRCYKAQRRALSLTGALGKTCSIPSCQTTSTHQWYKDPSDPQKDLCQRCYKAQRRTLKKSNDSSDGPSKKRRIS